MDRALLKAFRKEQTGRPVFWFMRQAGRYLPEYKELRSKAKGFLDFCYRPDMASEATLQPIRRFGMDGAIIFSDILVVPHAMGADVRFIEGEGPVIAPIRDGKSLASLKGNPSQLEPVYEALRLTRKALPGETTLIGFTGAPWTLACYMVQGKGDRDYQVVRQIVRRENDFFVKLIEVLTEQVALHAIKQIEAGAEAIQIFDSWAGVLSETEFAQWSIAPAKAIVAKIKAKHPNVPIIGFPRMCGSKTVDYVKNTGVDAVSIDGSVSLSFAKESLQPLCTVQGNLDNVVLAEDKDAMLSQAERIVASLRDKSFVFNLGHGILPHTPVENVQALSEFLKRA